MVRGFSQLLIYGIIDNEVEDCGNEISEELKIDVIPTNDAETVVRQSDLVVTTTPSKEPYLHADWLHPGLHITCMGSYSEDKQELFPEVFSKADQIDCDRKSQVFRLGELHHALEESAISSKDEILELGEITSGDKPGRG